MTYLSHKQLIFRDYLMSRIGFVHDEFLYHYQNELEKSSNKFKLLGLKDKVYDELSGGYEPLNGNEFIDYVELEDYFIPKHFTIIDYLNAEVKIRRSEIKLKTVNNFKYVSASDIASFIYCPVSFSINKTFELIKIDSTITGEKGHQKSLIFNHIKRLNVKFEDNESSKLYVPDFSIYDYADDSNRYLFELIENSDLIYCGHSNKTEEKFFKNEKGNFVGQPDFIFRDKRDGSYFVIEEKYQIDKTQIYENLDEHYSMNSEKKTVFFDNHLSQVNSYLHGIFDYEISYAFLVYWSYSNIDWSFEITKCSVKKITKTENGRNKFIEDFKNVASTIRQGERIFNPNTRNAKKCSNCVSNYLCGHKTGKFEKFTFPYSTEYLKLMFIPFPEELKKKPDDTEN